ncbi:MAG TPA: hypothetical protein VIW64_14055 [Pyrinomonadaceae bacterium]|jgi:hypothetical protein
MSAETFPVLLTRKLKTFPRKLELGDFVLLIYVAAFVRQWFWIVNSNPLAWVFTIIVSLLVWLLHLSFKDDKHKLPHQFWLLIALPLFVIYAMRAAFPDTSFDVLDYRLMNSERALRGLPLITGDFFPVRFPFNPAPDMVTGISRHLLGYRLGTILNYLVVIWIAAILLKFLRPYFKSAWLACTGVLLLLLTEHLLFVVNNYMVDLLALPLLLEATRIALLAEEKNSNRDAVRLAIYLGASAAFKLTNLAFALPILLVYAYNCGRATRTTAIRAGTPHAAHLRRAMTRKFLLIACAFLLPLVPYTLYIYWQTRNPVFPLFNQIFRSPFWPTNDPGVRWGPIVDDPRWLDMKWWEVLLWPVLLPFRIEHTAGNLGPHAGRISLGFIAAIMGLLLKLQRNTESANVSPAMSTEREQFADSTTSADAVGRASRPRSQPTGSALRACCFSVLLGSILWSMLSGMLRYATYLELAGGVIVLALAANLYQRAQTSKQIVAVALWAILGVQAATACVYVYRFEWATRPTAFDNPRAFLNDAKYFLRDYSLASFLPAPEQALIAPASAWAESSALESGIEVQLKSAAPALCLYMPEYFGTPESKTRFAQALAALGDRKLYSLCYVEHFPGALESIKAAGLTTGKIVPVVIPYYSDYTRIQMALIEVVRADHSPQANAVQLTAARAPLKDEYMHAEIELAQPLPDHLHPGLRKTIYLRVRNTGAGVWPALAEAGGHFRLLLGNHWLRENNEPVVNDDGRSALLYDLRSGEETEMLLTVTAPSQPGNYVLEIDMVQEGVAWFASKGSKPLRVIVKVE